MIATGRSASAGRASTQYLVQATSESSAPRRSRMMLTLGCKAAMRGDTPMGAAGSAAIADNLPRARGDRGGEGRPASGGSAASSSSAGVGFTAKGARARRHHGGVVEGIAEDHIRMRPAGALQRERLAFVRRHIEQRAGNAAICDCHPRAQNALRSDAEVAGALFDDPVVGGADCPDLAAGGRVARRPSAPSQERCGRESVYERRSPLPGVTRFLQGQCRVCTISPQMVSSESAPVR